MFRVITNVNWYGVYTLTLREVFRFLKVYNQTIIAPAVSALLFLLIFILAFDGNSNYVYMREVKFYDFIGYGLIIMTIIQNAFANSSSSIIISKVIGYIHDILMPPLSGFNLAISFCLGSIFRGIIVGLVVTLLLCPFIQLTVYHPIILVIFVLLASLFTSILGILTGVISNSFEHCEAVTRYIIAPLSFLSGTFYSINRLPKFLQIINKANPFFYIIDGFRYTLTNYSDSNIKVGIIILVLMNVFLFSVTVKVLDIGWNTKG